MSFDIKFRDVQEKNYKWTIPKLHKEIVPEKCKVIVDPKRNMYNEGDADMKATIAKAWTDAKFGRNG
ncbi:hypothetical protein ACE6H2_013567 [Prunus campanulata]